MSRGFMPLGVAQETIEDVLLGRSRVIRGLMPLGVAQGLLGLCDRSTKCDSWLDAIRRCSILQDEAANVISQAIA